jgi:hypothetical protein
MFMAEKSVAELKTIAAGNQPITARWEKMPLTENTKTDRRPPDLPSVNRHRRPPHLGRLPNDLGRIASPAGRLANDRGILAKYPPEMADNRGRFAFYRGILPNDLGRMASPAGRLANDLGRFANDR